MADVRRAQQDDALALLQNEDPELVQALQEYLPDFFGPDLAVDKFQEEDYDADMEEI